MLTAIATGAPPAVLAELLIAAETDRVFADGGHSLDFINKCFECLDLIGWPINSNPKNLPAGLLSVEHSKYERTLIAALRNTGYYDVSVLSSEAEAERGLAQGELFSSSTFLRTSTARLIEARRHRYSSTPMRAIPPP